MPDNVEGASISAWLEAIHNAIKEHTEAVHKYEQAKASQREQEVHAETKAVVRLPVEVTEYYRSEQGERPVRDRRDQIRLRLEIAGVAVASALAVLTFLTLLVFYCQLVTTQQQVSEAAKDAISARRHGRRELQIAQEQANTAEKNVRVIETQMKQEERAWMRVTYGIPNNVDSSEFLVDVTNVGHSPALKTLANAVFEVVDNDKKPILRRSGQHTQSIFSILFPQDEKRFSVMRFNGDGSIRELTSVEIQRLKHGDSYLVIYGDVHYRDQFGRHWTRFCDWHAFGGSKTQTFNASSCVEDNAVGDGAMPDK